MKSLDIALKDLRAALRNRVIIGMSLGIPLLIVGLIFLAFGGLSSNKKAPEIAVTNVVVANLDRPVAGMPGFGELLANFLRDSSLKGLVRVTQSQDEASARKAVADRKAGVAIIIPEDFSQAVVLPDARATVSLIQDPVMTVGPGIVRSLVEQFLDGFSGSKMAAKLVGDEAKSPGAPRRKLQGQPLPETPGTAPHFRSENGDSPEFPGAVPSFRGAREAGSAYGQWASTQGGKPAVTVQEPVVVEKPTNVLAFVMGRVMAGMMIFFSFYSAAAVAMTIIKEDEDGTLARLFATPTSKGAVLGGKFLSVLLVVALQVIVLMLAARLAFGVRWGRLELVAPVALGMMVAASGFGVFLMSFVRTARQTGPVVGGVLSTTGMLAGLFTPLVPNMPAVFARIALVFPQGWAMRGLTLALAGIGDARWFVTVAVLFGAGLLFLLIGAMRARRRFA
jgi:ABC-2 type transport system permease protein